MSNGVEIPRICCSRDVTDKLADGKFYVDDIKSRRSWDS